MCPLFFGRINPKLYCVFNKFKFTSVALNFMKKKFGGGSACVTCETDRHLLSKLLISKLTEGQVVSGYTVCVSWSAQETKLKPKNGNIFDLLP